MTTIYELSKNVKYLYYFMQKLGLLDVFRSVRTVEKSGSERNRISEKKIVSEQGTELHTERANEKRLKSTLAFCMHDNVNWVHTYETQ